jgi:ribosomal-protein-alanine N-acetyltransferase
MEFLNARLDRTESDGFVDRIVARGAQDGFGLWAVQVDGAFAGYVGLARAGFEASFTPAVEVGWRLARAYWGRGIATEGARAALGYGFDEVGMDEIDSWTALVNARSWRVMERLGMVRDIEFEHPLVPDGHPARPHVLYRLPRQTWAGSGRADTVP